MEFERALDPQRLSHFLELVGERLPTKALQSEFPDLTREDIRSLFQGLAAHVRRCHAWSGLTSESAELPNDVCESHASLYCDGASKGNPGPAGAGAVLMDQQDESIVEVSRFLGDATNNEAEYQALITGLKAAEDFGIKRLKIYSDSELLVKQVCGAYRVRQPHLQRLFGEVMSRLQRLDDYAIVHLGRELNRKADRLANEAINRSLRGGKREEYRVARRE